MGHRSRPHIMMPVAAALVVVIVRRPHSAPVLLLRACCSISNCFNTACSPNASTGPWTQLHALVTHLEHELADRRDRQHNVTTCRDHKSSLPDPAEFSPLHPRFLLAGHCYCL